MRNPILKTLSLAATLALVAPATLAQNTVVDTLFTFEGADGMGDVQGWEVTQDLDDAATEENSDIQTKTQKAVGGGNFIDAFEGTYLLEMTPDRPLKARSFRGGKYTWSTPQNWSRRPTLKLAASMNARGPSSERHEFRIRVISGTGAAADTTEMVYEGLKSEGADDTTPFNSFVNDWEVLTFDLSQASGFDLTQITSIEAAGRNVDEGDPGTPLDSDGNWGGLVHLDLVTIEGVVNTAGEDDQPGLRSLSAPYPNPAAAGAATLDLAVEKGQRVTARVVDVLGRTVQTAFAGAAAPGAVLPIRVETARLAAGTYVVVVEGETFRQSRRLTVTR